MKHAFGLVLLYNSAIYSEAADCTAGGEGLCSCSELIKAGAIPDFDSCTVAVAIEACEAGVCNHEARAYSYPNAKCSYNSDHLCSCSELIRSKVITHLDDCSEKQRLNACIANTCSRGAGTNQSNNLRSIGRQPSILSNFAPLPFYFADPFGPLRLSWGFDNNSKIEIEMTLPSDYYIGLGLDPAGTGDVIAGWIDHETGRAVIGDYWDLGRREPETDESRGCSNDIEVVGGAFLSYETTIRFRRKLVTGDRRNCDMDIRKGPMLVNYAYCDAPWCFDGFASNGGCNAYAEGCIDSAHSGGAAASYVEIDWSGNSSTV